MRGGSTKYLVELLEEGLTDYILDGQTFDLEGVRSMRENANHVNTSPFTSYNFHGKGNFASMVDVAVLGATEVDVNFNANVVTHSDGYLLHGIGGWQNCLYAKCTILAIPSFIIPADSIKSATYSAMRSLSGDFVTSVVPETIFFGSPSNSTSTT